MRQIMRITILLGIAAGFLVEPSAAQKFYPDDPLVRDPKPRDAAKAVRRKISDYYDFFLQTFSSPGEQIPEVNKNIPAQAVNTLGEPMEGAWYTRRHYYSPMSIEDLVRGPGNTNAPSLDGKWKVVKAKSEGVTPGFEFIDSKGDRYVLKFDPLEWPEIATAPDVLVSKFFYALGYHVPENYIVEFERDQLELGQDIELVDARGQARKMQERDLTELLIKVPKNKNDKYRGGASLYLKGKPLGPYKYYGMRRDDPNDIVNHEHRRDLRGLSVFCAWLAHDDSRAINSQDMLIEEDKVSYIRHHLIDFGSTLGSASYGPNSPRSGFEYVFEPRPAIRQFFTLGLLVPHWAKADYPNYKAVGRFEAEEFRAEEWIAEYPNPAFTNRLPDDAFWAAKQVMAFTDEQIRAIVKTGQYSDPRTEKWIADCLIKRRDKIGRAFFTQVLPLDRFSIRGGRLEFDNLAVQHGFAKEPAYQIAWSVFDNRNGTKTPISGAASQAVPAGNGTSDGYVAADIHGGNAKLTVTVFIRKRGTVLEVAGIDRGF
jgi:hypothetical protein